MFDTSELDVIDNSIAYSPEIGGQECNSCFRLLSFSFFDRDSSYRIGYKPQCQHCRVQPRLSMAEHLSNLKETNFNSEGVKRQRHEDQEEFKKVDARLGRPMHCSELLLRLQKLVPSLFVKEGGIVGDLALYLVTETPQAKWGGKNYKYMGYASFTTMPEYSLYEFDTERDILIRAREQGWRAILLRFIKADLITEDDCRTEFGYATGDGSLTWHKQLFNYRHETLEARKARQAQEQN
jgi:hypothetical protein